MTFAAYPGLRAPWRRLLHTLLTGLCLAAVTAGCAADDDAATRRFTFSWQFLPDDAMRPRGGTSRGPAVELRATPADAWHALQAEDLSPFERDRRAILAMAGGYRTTFDFIETVGFRPGFEPAAPYQSWGTEKVYVVADRGDFISLQHIMVMFYEGPDGDVRGPVVQKHWRQDWTYENTDVHAYAGDGRWQRRRMAPGDVEGRWSQAVFQVDDSPRYEAVGEWRHEGNYSAWTGESTWRPLPRRESSVRDDYDVLVATNRHTITPRGWVHEEDNLKAVVAGPGKLAAGSPFLAREVGVNRYQRTAGFDFSAGDAYWESTAPFWGVVRRAWSRILESQDTFALADEVDGEALFEPLFGYAARLEAGEFDTAAAEAFVDDVLERFVRR